MTCDGSADQPCTEAAWWQWERRCPAGHVTYRLRCPRHHARELGWRALGAVQVCGSEGTCAAGVSSVTIRMPDTVRPAPRGGSR